MPKLAKIILTLILICPVVIDTYALFYFIERLSLLDKCFMMVGFSLIETVLIFWWVKIMES